MNGDAVNSAHTHGVGVISEEAVYNTEAEHYATKHEAEPQAPTGGVVLPQSGDLCAALETSQNITNIPGQLDNPGLNSSGQTALTSDLDGVEPTPRLLQHVHSNHSDGKKSDTMKSKKALLNNTGSASNSKSEFVKLKSSEAESSLENSSELQLLPPTAFMVKKDGTPILEGSSVLPGVFRTESALQEGTATLCVNHFNVETSPRMDGSRDQTLLLPRMFVDGNAKESGTGNEGADGKSADSHFLSPADEMVYIRNRLLAFKQLKIKCRFVT